jgi:hypothetical protein
MAKLRVALGGEAGTANWIAPKPKGMWHRTYERKKFEICWCENQAYLLFIGKHSHLLSQSVGNGWVIGSIGLRLSLGFRLGTCPNACKEV